MNHMVLEQFLRVMCLLLLMSVGIFQAPAAKAITASQIGETLKEVDAAAVPAGFNRILWGTGVSLYKNDSYGEHSSTAYVQTVALNRGASVELLHGGIVNAGTGQGVYGGNNPTIRRTSLEDAWNANP